MALVIYLHLIVVISICSFTFVVNFVAIITFNFPTYFTSFFNLTFVITFNVKLKVLFIIVAYFELLAISFTFSIIIKILNLVLLLFIKDYIIFFVDSCFFFNIIRLIFSFNYSLLCFNLKISFVTSFKPC